MADRWDNYYRQLVLEDDLDSAHGALEQAAWDAVADIGLCRDNAEPDVFGGIVSGYVVSYLSGLDMTVTAGVGYDHLGRRVATGASFTATVSNQGDTEAGAGGVGDGSSAAPTNGYERWVSIFVVYDRYLDPAEERYDGYNQKVYYSRAESFHFYYSPGTEKTIGTLLTSDKPARESGKLLLADVRIKKQSNVTQYVSMDQLRKEILFNLIGTNLPNKTITQGLIREALLDMLKQHR